ncbi:MAG: hypothetical protein AB7N91_27900 [Candidatus Tectimicrobiota bacterium]
MARKLFQGVTLLALLTAVSPVALAAEMTCTRADDNGCAMAKGGNGEEMKVTAPGARIGDKMNGNEKGTCSKTMLQ